MEELLDQPIPPQACYWDLIRLGIFITCFVIKAKLVMEQKNNNTRRLGRH